MGLYPRERLPNAAAAYLEAYIALETSAHKAQTLVDRLLSLTLALTGESISRSRNPCKFSNEKNPVSALTRCGFPRHCRLASSTSGSKDALSLAFCVTRAATIR